MREIKFRAKRVDNGDWVYGCYFTTPLTAENFEADSFQSGKIRACISSQGVVYEINPETLGQYTGLKDKNGKEIYEGDIIEELDSDRDNIGYVHLGIYEIHTTKCGIPCYVYGLKERYGRVLTTDGEYEIIGNIYENPEFTKKWVR